MMRRPKFFKGNIWEANWTVWEWTESVRISARIGALARIWPLSAAYWRVSAGYPVRILCVTLRILCVLGAYPCVSAVNSVRIRVTDLSRIDRVCAARCVAVHRISNCRNKSGARGR